VEVVWSVADDVIFPCTHRHIPLPSKRKTAGSLKSLSYLIITKLVLVGSACHGNNVGGRLSVSCSRNEGRGIQGVDRET
jgi:hypothetical protein